MPDTGTPLCSYAQFTSGWLGDLVTGIDEGDVNDYLLEGSRMCEDATGRRFAPFTTTETHRAEGIDPDEYSDSANLPMDIRSTLGASYANALGASSLVRHCWLDEKAPRYPEMWQYTNVQITIIRSYGGTQQVSPFQILNGPEPDTGHLWFQLGIFLPIASRIQVTYTAGYVPSPASLVRANKFMTASNIVRELNPGSTNHNPDQLYNDALLVLKPWMGEQ
jgi:hypothetical protein